MAGAVELGEGEFAFLAGVAGGGGGGDGQRGVTFGVGVSYVKGILGVVVGLPAAAKEEPPRARERSSPPNQLERKSRSP